MDHKENFKKATGKDWYTVPVCHGDQAFCSDEYMAYLENLLDAKETLAPVLPTTIVKTLPQLPKTVYRLVKKIDHTAGCSEQEIYWCIQKRAWYTFGLWITVQMESTPARIQKWWNIYTGQLKPIELDIIQTTHG